MKLENTIRFHFPKSSRIDDETRSTSPDNLTGPDAIAALGMTQNEAGFGIAAFFGKIGLSQNDKNKAVSLLMKRVRARCVKAKVMKTLSARQRARAIYLIALYAYENYCQTPENPESRCESCKGRGKVLDRERSYNHGQHHLKDCPRCLGRGFMPIPASKLFRSLKAIIPELSQPTFSRQLKPIYDDMLSVCVFEELHAEAVLSEKTK